MEYVLEKGKKWQIDPLSNYTFLSLLGTPYMPNKYIEWNWIKDWVFRECATLVLIACY